MLGVFHCHLQARSRWTKDQQLTCERLQSPLASTHLHICTFRAVHICTHQARQALKGCMGGSLRPRRMLLVLRTGQQGLLGCESSAMSVCTVARPTHLVESPTGLERAADLFTLHLHPHAHRWDHACLRSSTLCSSGRVHVAGEPLGGQQRGLEHVVSDSAVSCICLQRKGVARNRLRG